MILYFDLDSVGDGAFDRYLVWEVMMTSAIEEIRQLLAHDAKDLIWLALPRGCIGQTANARQGWSAKKVAPASTMPDSTTNSIGSSDLAQVKSHRR